MRRRILVASTALTAITTISLALTGLGPASGAAPHAGRSADQRSAALAKAPQHDSSQPRQVDAPVPTISWSPCNDGSGLQCANVRVPLDYDHPHGTTKRLFMSRLRADPQPGETKTGTLFVNPGGPGAPASQVPGFFASLLGKGIHQRFDVVGIDPRGIGGAPLAHCRIADPAPTGFGRAFPMTSSEVRRLVRFYTYERESCRRGGSPIIDHMTTADTARDMDLIRQAVGDQKLTYYGISYGTYLGATYARMFPGRVRALITDGVLDPVAWSTGRSGAGTKVPFSYRLRSGHGAAEALTSAFAVCDRVGRNRCAFAGNAAGKWRTMVTRLRKGPVRLSDGKLYYANLVSGVLGALYSRSAYRPVMHQLQQLWNHFPHPSTHAKDGTQQLGAEDDAALIEVRDALAQHVRPFPYAPGRFAPATHASTANGYGPAFFPTFEGVACADTLNPSDPYAVQRAAVRSESTGQPWFGRLWTWASGACPRWPGSHADAFRGPWHIRTSTPVLIVANMHDPATPISGARALHGLFGNSRLITMNGWGHGALGESRCVTRAFSSYLVHRALPTDGKVCQPDKGLFPVRR